MPGTDHTVNMRFLWNSIGPHRGRAVAAVCLMLLDTALASLGIGMVLPVFQVLLDPQHDNHLLRQALPFLTHMEPESRLAFIALFTVALFSVKGGNAMLAAITMNDFLQRMRFHWMERIGERYLLGPYLYVASAKQGLLLNNWFNETLAASRFLQAYMTYLSSSALTMSLVTLGLMVNWRAMLAMLAVVGLVVMAARGRIYRGSARLSQIKLQLNQAITTCMVENLTNVRALKLFGTERPRLAQLASLLGDLKSALLQAVIMAEIPRVSSEFVAVTSLMAAVVISVVMMKLPVQDALPALAFFFIAFYRMVGAGSIAMSSRVKAMNEWHSVLAVDALVDGGPAQEELEAGAPIDGIESDIEFRNVAYQYEGQRGALRGITATIPRGKVTCLIGASGAGKSTMLDLMLRFIEPAQGVIQVNGLDAKTFRLADWRRCFGYAGQEAGLFHGSVRMNLRLVKPSASDDEIEEACRLAGADAFVRALPQGYETVIGERGFSLSEGERKRIAIARAIIARPPALVLDEATTSFELSLEQEIIERLKAALPGVTILQVTHRLQSAVSADWVIALRGGAVSAQGPWRFVQAQVVPLLAHEKSESCGTP